MSLKKFKLMGKLYLYRLNNGIPHHYERLHDNSIIEYPIVGEYKLKWKLNLLLFIVTFATTTLFAPSYGDTTTDIIINGLPYSITLMTILLFHEFGHFFAARRFNVKSTLPFFIPFPSIIGTMGAIIKTKSPIPHTKALFYIGSMGPLPGFIVSLFASLIGVYLSEVKQIPTGDGIYIQLGDSILFSAIVHLIHGEIQPGLDLFLHPIAWAGWIGFLITSLNLMPLGQLDGGHILYSLIGKKQRYAGWICLFALVALSFIWPGWAVWVFMTLFLLMVAHPPVRQVPLSLKEKITGWLCMIIFILTFIPVPVQIG